jgi:hypothetical protein
VRIGADGSIGYASPNAINILRAAGASSVGPGELSSTLPGSAVAVSPVLTSGAGGAYAVEIDAAGHTLSYRTIALGEGAFVLVEDITEQRRREQELKVKEATIREVHHRVKNNLQTIASLLRIQERRTDSEEASRALGDGPRDGHHAPPPRGGAPDRARRRGRSSPGLLPHRFGAPRAGDRANHRRGRPRRYAVPRYGEGYFGDHPRPARAGEPARALRRPVRDRSARDRLGRDEEDAACGC